MKEFCEYLTCCKPTFCVQCSIMMAESKIIWLLYIADELFGINFSLYFKFIVKISYFMVHYVCKMLLSYHMQLVCSNCWIFHYTHYVPTWDSKAQFNFWFLTFFNPEKYLLSNLLA